MGADKLAPGKSSVVLPAPADPAVGKPGKSTLVGDQWIDHGAVCDGKDATTDGCIFSDPQRMRLLIDFGNRVQNAQTNYKLALAEVRVDELLKKEQDLHWVLGLALDLAGAHVASVAIKALQSARTSGIDALMGAAMRGEEQGKWSARGEGLLKVLTEKRIESTTKAVFDGLKKGASGAAQGAQNQGSKTDKAETQSFLVALQNGCDAAFGAFSSTTSGTANDAELVVLWSGMHASHHTPAKYKAELAAKLERYRKSGVTEIGKPQWRPFGPDSDYPTGRTMGHGSMWSDVRVVWAEDIRGGKTLWYEKVSQQSGTFNHQTIRHEHLRPVPEEFADAARARSEEQFGTTPVVDDPESRYLRNHGFDVDKMREQHRKTLPRLDLVRKPTLPAAIPPDSVFAPEPKP